MRFPKLPPRDWFLVLGLVIVLYILQNFILPLISAGYLATYLGRPILWGLLAVLVLRLPRQSAVGKARLRSLLVKLAVGVGFVQVYLTVVAGFLTGFGKSTNSFTPRGIVINVLFMFSNLMAVELSRAWLLNRLTRKPTALLPIFVAVFFTFFNLAWTQIPRLNSDLQTFTKFFGSDFLPLFMENYLASYLALWGGVWPAVAYRAVLQGFSWFSPVLPNLNWALKALTGTVVPAVGMALIQEGFVSGAMRPAKHRGNSGKGLLSWTLLSVFAVLAVWFSLGVFPFQPRAIISGSMRPTFNVGDIVIVAKRNQDLLKVGDIIQFRGMDSSIPTVHRIIEFKEDGGEKLIVTKGDANNGPDPYPAHLQDVTGTVVFIVPKVGWVPVVIRQLFTAGRG